jgi:hypothetical protein
MKTKVREYFLSNHFNKTLIIKRGKRSMWSIFRDARLRRKKTWSEAHANTKGVLCGVPMNIPKKIRKKTNRRIFEFLILCGTKKRFKDNRKIIYDGSRIQLLKKVLFEKVFIQFATINE